ncbi:toll-like receptor 8 [Haliotis rubra]|uniref:toll-like receptor 8 n=1 Tax=Haliotis rubra TaxID=36100 RepID=UPI001EE62714|nr:toll-like receptor 8 [Haliotis rubra]
MPLREVFVFLTLGICQRNGDACALHFDKHYGGLFADCNGRKLQHVPQDLPANITALDISENDVTTMTKFTFLKLKNLTYLNLNMNPLSKLEPEAFAGLFSLTTLLLARNKLSNDKPSFPDEVFRDLVSLHTLNLEKTEMSSYPDWVFPPLVKLHSLYIDSVPHPLFGPGFSNLANLKESLGVSSVFSTLTSLEYLDISLNDIRYFRLLSVPANIIHINLSHNQFETVPIETFDYRSLNLIDISFNLIGQMDRDTRLKLDLSAEKNNLKLIIKGNTFSCSCRNLDFILWLVDTPVIYENDRNFPCILDNGTMTGTVDVAKQYESLYHYCTGKLILNLTITFSVVILTAIVATYTVSKNSVRYRNIVLRIFGLGIQYLTPKDFDFTFYVGYCETDIPFVYHKLRHGLELCSQPVRLFLKDRDVLPGVPIADGIICGITYSWKSVLVISDDFLQDCSQWSQFTIDAALYSVTDLIPNRIIVLLVGPVQVEDLPERLLNVVEEECILRVEDYQHGDVKLWKVLREIAKV